MTKQEVFEAFREVASEEFADIPAEEDIHYEFSPRFNKKMKAISRRLEYGDRRRFKLSRRAIAAIAAILILLIGGAITAGAGWDTLVKIVTGQEKGGDRFTFYGQHMEQIEKEYKLTYIPDGFVKTEERNEKNCISVVYENRTTGDRMKLEQSVGSRDMKVDNECGKTVETYFAGKLRYIYRRHDGSSVYIFWIEGAYIMDFDYMGDISDEELVKILESIE